MQTALLLIDIQNDYFNQGAMPLVGSAEASEKAKLILESFRISHKPVIHVQHVAARPTASFFLPNTQGVCIHSNVMPEEHEKVIVKNFPNSFVGTDLLDRLKEDNVTDLVVCGMMTHMCVDATVRAAKDFGFQIVLIGDACATKDLEIQGQPVKASDVQNSFLAALAYYYATVKTAQQYLGGR